jgi:SGNH domain (fused to AT3 domains)
MIILNYLKSIALDAIGIKKACGPLVAIQWLLCIGVTLPECLRAGNLQPADRRMGTGHSFDRDIGPVVRKYNVSTVIMVANWTAYLRTRKIHYEDIAATVATLRARGLRVILIGQSPVFPFAYPDEYFFKKFPQGEPVQLHGEPVQDYYAPLNADPNLNARILEAAHPDVFFDPMKSLCRASECIFKQGDSYLVEDYGHWTHDGSVLAVAKLMEAANRSR